MFLIFFDFLVCIVSLSCVDVVHRLMTMSNCVLCVNCCDENCCISRWQRMYIVLMVCKRRSHVYLCVCLYLCVGYCVCMLRLYLSRFHNAAVADVYFKPFVSLLKSDQKLKKRVIHIHTSLPNAILSIRRHFTDYVTLI